MKKILIAPVILLLASCASQEPSLQSQVNSLNDRVTLLTSDMATIATSVTLANEKSGDALTAANRAADLAKETNDKLDLVFKKALAK
jgi:outer membrane murein-binding lipoprotein Lpp